MKKIEDFKPRLIQSLISAVCSILIGVALYPLLFGMPLKDMPVKSDIAEIRLEYAGETVTLTEEEDVALGLNLVAYLKYKPNRETDMGKDCVTVTITEKNGQETVIKASTKAVTYKGKTCELKEQYVFMNGMQGLFFGKEGE